MIKKCNMDQAGAIVAPKFSVPLTGQKSYRSHEAITG